MTPTLPLALLEQVVDKLLHDRDAGAHDDDTLRILRAAVLK